MNAKFLLPLAAVSLIALAACESGSDAPEIPDPDAGTPPIEAEPETENSEVDLEPTQDIEQNVEEVEQEAADTFQSILEQSQDAGNQALDAGERAMQSLSDDMDSLRGALDQQIDSIVQSVEGIRDENMTDTEKADAVANARAAAEQAARSLGQSQTEIEAAGDRAAQGAADVLDYQLP